MRLSILPLSTVICFIYNLLVSMLEPSFFDSQFAIAESNNFSNLFDASLALNFRILIAFSTSSPGFPRLKENDSGSA